MCVNVGVEPVVHHVIVGCADNRHRDRPVAMVSWPGVAQRYLICKMIVVFKSRKASLIRDNFYCNLQYLGVCILRTIGCVGHRELPDVNNVRN